MRLHSLAFAGYRSFAARSPAAPDRQLQRLPLAPLTILLGKNNSGKSTVARLLHHVLFALGADGNDPFPMGDGRHSYGTRFRDVQHGGSFFSPLDLDVELQSDEGDRMTLIAQLIQLGELEDDQPPAVQKMILGTLLCDEMPRLGLMPDIPEALRWRQGARRLLDASCHLGPIRESARRVYSVASSPPSLSSAANPDAVAQLLFADTELRACVGAWIVEHLEGWRVDVQQNLEAFSLLARRGGRESNLADSGEGIKEVFPFVSLCCGRKLGRGNKPFLDIIEQPELHLHDAAHAPLGDLLLSAVAGGRGNVVVETHSESLVLRVRRRIAEGLRPEHVSIVYVEDTPGGSRLRPIPVSPTGEVEWWPEGVFSEAFEEVKAIRRAQRAREQA